MISPAAASTTPVLPYGGSSTQTSATQVNPQPAAAQQQPLPPTLARGPSQPILMHMRAATTAVPKPTTQIVDDKTTILDMVKWNSKLLNSSPAAQNFTVLGEVINLDDVRLGICCVPSGPKTKLSAGNAASDPANQQDPGAIKLGKEAVLNVLTNTAAKYSLGGTPAGQTITDAYAWVSAPGNRLTTAELGTLMERVNDAVIAQQPATKPDFCAPRLAKRMPMECMAHLGREIQRATTANAQGPHAAFLQNLGEETQLRVMQHNLKFDDTKAWLNGVETRCKNEGLPELEKLAKELSASIPEQANAANYHTRLHDNIYGRALESAIVDQLVRNPPAAVKTAMGNMAAHLDTQLTSLTPQARQFAAWKVQDMMRHERRGWQTESPALEQFFNAPPGEVVNALERLLRAPVENGFDSIAIPYLTVKLSLSMQAEQPVQCPDAAWWNQTRSAITADGTQKGLNAPGSSIALSQTAMDAANNMAGFIHSSLNGLPHDRQKYTAWDMQRTMLLDRAHLEAQSSKLTAFLDASPEQVLPELYKQMNAASSSGDDSAAIYHLALKMTESLGEQASHRQNPENGAPWMRAANENYGSVIDAAAARHIGTTNLNRMAPTSGITTHHQPYIADGTEPAMHPSDRNRPKLESPSNALKTALENGLPYVSGVSGSTNIGMHMVHQMQNINAQEALLGIMMFLTYDGGHSMHEALWVAHQLSREPGGLPVAVSAPRDPAAFEAKRLEFLGKLQSPAGADVSADISEQKKKSAKEWAGWLAIDQGTNPAWPTAALAGRLAKELAENNFVADRAGFTKLLQDNIDPAHGMPAHDIAQKVDMLIEHVAIELTKKKERDDFIGDYQSFLGSFTPTGNEPALTEVAKNAWNDTLSHFAQHSYFSSENPARNQP
ncbi:hypothetical protein [Pseudoduganella violacea]|uniref:Uncharacterized protein n=1 Tax=Pseudoduganella violacea TaxID=1715466 RepID=A0A7W5BFD3_9BURK|nr:hypothetical protein [Pseudoduganella violacea]MBB3122139.1 hypothetical protein [Pseudoduganella violacea]